MSADRHRNQPSRFFLRQGTIGFLEYQRASNLPLDHRVGHILETLKLNVSQDREQVLERAKQAGVVALIVTGMHHNKS